MKIKLTIYHYFTVYFFLLMVLYHQKIKSYFYWKYIESLQGAIFDFSWPRFILVVGLFFTNLYFLSKVNQTKFIFIILSLFFTLLTIPSLIAYTSGDIYPHRIMIYHQIFFYVLLLFSKVKINFNRIPILNKTQSLYIILCLTTIGIIPYLIVYGPYINLKNLILIDVYQTRTSMGRLSNPYFGYTYSIFTKILIPLIIVFSLELKKKIWVVVGILYLVLFYLFGAHKTVYVGLLMVLIFYRFSFKQSVKFLIKFSSIAIVFCLILAFFGYDYPWILSFRRVHFLPALLDICYVDYFQDNFLFWSNSILKNVIDYPYDVRAVNLIGEVYFKRSNMAANNGLISEGFMNFGTLGVFFNIIVVSFFFMVLNSLKLPSKYFGVFVLTIFSFLSSSVFTVLLTHGGIAIIIISIFVLKEKQK